MSENCIPFVLYSDDELRDSPLLHCPNCGAFLPRSTQDDEFPCKKCDEPLTVLWDEGEESGRICKMPDHLKKEV